MAAWWQHMPAFRHNDAGHWLRPMRKLSCRLTVTLIAIFWSKAGIGVVTDVRFANGRVAEAVGKVRKLFYMFYNSAEIYNYYIWRTEQRHRSKRNSHFQITNVNVVRNISAFCARFCWHGVNHHPSLMVSHQRQHTRLNQTSFLFGRFNWKCHCFPLRLSQKNVPTLEKR